MYFRVNRNKIRLQKKKTEPRKALGTAGEVTDNCKGLFEKLTAKGYEEI